MTTTTTQPNAERIHKFEAAGLGKAPFRCVGMTEERWSPCPGVPAKPAGTCDYCGMGIANVFHILSADGKRFRVGCDCVEKVGDSGLKRICRKHISEAKSKRDDARIEAAYAVLEDPDRQDVRDRLAALSTGRGTVLDYVRWMKLNAGQSGKLRCAREIERAAREVGGGGRMKPPLPKTCRKCGRDASVKHCYCTSRGHGYAVVCGTHGCEWGPWAKTEVGAVRLWNKK